MLDKLNIGRNISDMECSVFLSYIVILSFNKFWRPLQPSGNLVLVVLGELKENFVQNELSKKYNYAGAIMR